MCRAGTANKVNVVTNIKIILLLRINYFMKIEHTSTSFRPRYICKCYCPFTIYITFRANSNFNSSKYFDARHSSKSLPTKLTKHSETTHVIARPIPYATHS
jgi:hypothetical protein